MNQELKDLLTLVKHSKRSARHVVETYFSTMGWSILKDEWERMSADEREAFINKLEDTQNG